MNTKITKFGFLGLRRLNLTSTDKPLDEFIGYWETIANKYKYDAAKRINVFIGTNGAGKSTVIELLDILRDPARIATIPRENLSSDSPSVFLVEFDNKTRLICSAAPIARQAIQNAPNLGSSIDTRAITIRGITLDALSKPDEIKFKFVKNISKVRLDELSISELKSEFRVFNCNVCYWTSDATPSIDALIDILNDAEGQLTGLISAVDVKRDEGVDEAVDEIIFQEKRKKSFRRLGQQNERLSVWLSDDQDQPNNVSINALPSGWRNFASIIHWLGSDQVDQGSVCLIEEPEMHLHPRLQRLLARRMSEVATSRNLQLFISTHSAVFQQRSVWQVSEDDVHIFEATGDKLEVQPNISRVLDSLGIKNSDISQSNGVIWVEGPSDRIYIKHWLSLWCCANQKEEMQENIDYAFLFYGGSVLSHFGLESKELIQLLRINRNLAIVMDRDDDFSFSNDGELVILNENSAKVRVLNELKLTSTNGMNWITRGYSIESYLPDSFLCLCSNLVHPGCPWVAEAGYRSSPPQ